MKNKLLVTFFARKALKKSNGTVPIYCKVRYNKNVYSLIPKWIYI